MHRKTAVMMVALVVSAWVSPGAASAALDKAAMDKAFAALPKYDWGQSREPLNQIDEAIVQTYGDAAARKDLEKRLCAVLQADATRAAKQYCCRKLAIIGSADAVGALAPLLTSDELSHMGRYALERMPCPEAAQAMRDAMGKVSGKLKVGMINSLGARRDAGAVDALVAGLKDEDKQVAAAAAAALGRIGDKRAAPELAEFLDRAPKDLKGAAIDALLDFAQRLGEKGEKDEAARIYDRFYAENQPPRVRRAAFQGLCMVRPAQSTSLVLGALASSDPAFRGLAVQMVKEMPGTEAAQAFAAALPKLPAAGQVGLLDALAARKDTAARPAVLKAAGSDSPEVKVAAIKALGDVGGAADVQMLAKTAAANAEGTSDAARASLARLRGDDVNRTITSALAGGDAKVKVELIRALAARTASEAAPAVSRYTRDDDTDVRRSAIEALGQLGSERQVSALVAMVKAPKDKADRATLEQALAAICTRVREKATADLVAGIPGADSEAHVVLLNVLGRAGGDEALRAILDGTRSADAAVKDGAIRVLASWPTLAAMKPLLDIAESTDSNVHQVLAIRGVVQLARRRETPVPERFAALSKVITLAKGTGEKRLVLGAMGDVPTVEALKIVAGYLDEKALAQEAATAAVSIAKNDSVWRSERDLVRTTMTKVIEIVRNNRTKRDAQGILSRVAPRKK
jgi:HEAT repeat protein